MKISQSAWHARLYLWAAVAWVSFKGKNDFFHVPSKTTNLCDYISTITWRLLIIAIAHLWVVWLAIYTLIYHPIVNVGLTSYSTTVGIGILIAAGGVAIIVGIVFSIKIWLGFFAPKPFGFDEKNPGIIRQWIVDRHNRICSLVELTDDVKL